MKCPKCGSPNDKQNRNCAQCGGLLVFTTPIRITPEPAACLSDFILEAGDCFGSRYQIIEQIGAGGMGKVFKALDRELNIMVVLKIINPELSSSPDAVERFKRELLLAREIMHENVIRIYDLGEINGVRYISMNFVEGRNLQELIGMAGKLSVEKLLDISSKVCQALVAAHGKGIIHRDLKPQNVMIGKKGAVTVLDFGIARSLDQAGSTQTGMVIGTPECMAPEQIQGEEIDVSTDIYAVGVLMFQMVTGRVPFSADSTANLLLKHLHETPPRPSSINPAIPPALDRIILKCLKKNPRQRYATAKKLLQSIDRLLKTKARQEKRKQRLLPFRRPLRSRPLVYLGRLLELLILLFVLGTLIGWFLDYHFGIKLQRFTMEYPLYFKTQFPMDKDYLPADWAVGQGNAWDVYRRIMSVPAATQSAAERHLPREIENLYRGVITPANLEMVKGLLENAGAKTGMSKVISGISRGTLAPGPGERLAPAFVVAFSRWQALRARVGFLAADIAGGVERLRELGYFLVDCEAAAGGMQDRARAVGQFLVFCQELVPLALANDIDPAGKKLEKLEPLLLLFLKKMNERRFFQMAYLDDLQAVRQGSFAESWWTGPSYFWFGRFRFLAEMSSRNMSLCKILANESKARDELYAVSHPAKTRSILGRLRRDDGKDWPRVGSPDFYRLHNISHANRAMVKLVLLLVRLQRLDVNSEEMTALLKSEPGMNDLTGEPWKITCEAGNNVVHLTGRIKFVIRPASYTVDHTAIIADWRRVAAAVGASDIPRFRLGR